MECLIIGAMKNCHLKRVHYLLLWPFFTVFSPYCENFLLHGHKRLCACHVNNLPRLIESTYMFCSNHSSHSNPRLFRVPKESISSESCLVLGTVLIAVLLSSHQSSLAMLWCYRVLLIPYSSGRIFFPVKTKYRARAMVQWVGYLPCARPA